MVKMVIGEVQTQTEEIKAFGQSYSQALDAVSSATQGIQLAIGMTGAGMDSIKGYLSSVYPALCKAAIMHSEAVVQANEQYVQSYLSKCGSEDLDSDELQAQIDEADALIQGFQNSKDSYAQQKRSLSEEKDKLLGAVFQAAIVGMDAGIARNQAKKAKIQEKLDKFLDFCGQSDSYFSGLNNTGSIVAKGMQALGVSEKGQVGSGCWNGRGFSLADRSWITTTNKNWQTRLEVKDKKLLDGCTIIHVVDTDRGVDMFMFEKNGRRYPVSEQDLSDNLRTLVKKYGLNVVKLSPTEMDRRVTEFQKSGKDYFSGETVNMPGFKTLAKGQGIVNDLKDSGFWDAAWAAGLTVAAVRNAQNAPKKVSGHDYLDEQLGSMKNNVKVNQYESAESVNNWWKNQGYTEPPYTSKTVVQDLNLLGEGKFVRVYDKTNSNLHGGWLMAADDIKGLTPAQIQDRFALPHLPEYVGEVTIPKGSNLRMGEVNPLFGHKGGGVQFDLKGQYIGDFKELGTIKEWSGLK